MSMFSRFSTQHVRRNLCGVLAVAATATCAIFTAGAGAALPPLPAGVLPAIPDGLNVATSATVTASSPAIPGNPLSYATDGNASTKYCSSGLGIHTLTVDLGQSEDVTGTSATFSGEEGATTGAIYSVSYGTTAPGQTPFPNQTPGVYNLVQGALNNFAGTTANPTATVSARCVTLTWQVPREQNICVNEFRVFSADTLAAPQLELGGDLSALPTASTLTAAASTGTVVDVANAPNWAPGDSITIDAGQANAETKTIATNGVGTAGAGPGGSTAITLTTAIAQSHASGEPVADNGTYTLNGTATPALTILNDGGTNIARLDLLVNPTACGGSCLNLTNDLAAATQLKAAGDKILLNIEYSDSPTSSASQTTPAAWAGQNLTTLAATVQSYTQSVIAAFATNGTPVSQVALGNSITQGILWPAGQLTFSNGSTVDPSSWSALTTLLTAASQGATAGNPAGNPLSIELDLDAAADNTTSVDFLNHVIAAHVPFNVIGESYTPWLQGYMTEMQANIRSLASQYNMPIIIDQGQFPYGNVTGYGTYSLTVPFPDTVAGYLISTGGQVSWQRDLVNFMASLPNHLGLGVIYGTPLAKSSLGWLTTAGAAEPAVYSYRVGSGVAVNSHGLAAQPAAGASAQVQAHAAAAVADENDNTAFGALTPLVSSVPHDASPAVIPPPDGPTSGPLPPSPMGLDVAIGDPATANTGSQATNPLTNVDDGDGTNRWCSATPGVHQVTIDLGQTTNVTGTGITFTGENPNDGATYTVSTGLLAPNETPFPNQAAGNANPIAEGELYLFAGTTANNLTTVPARYVTLTYQVPREETICVNELRVFAPATPVQQKRLYNGADISTLIADSGTWKDLNGVTPPGNSQNQILSIFKAGGFNYGRLRLWVNPGGGTNPNLANDLIMGKEIVAAGMGLEIDFHYDDIWADPQHQDVPGQWAGETLPQLASTIQSYTQSVVQAFAAQGTPLSMVAIGNEITQGLVWTHDRLQRRHHELRRDRSRVPRTITDCAASVGRPTSRPLAKTIAIRHRALHPGAGGDQRRPLERPRLHAADAGSCLAARDQLDRGRRHARRLDHADGRQHGGHLAGRQAVPRLAGHLGTGRRRRVELQQRGRHGRVGDVADHADDRHPDDHHALRQLLGAGPAGQRRAAVQQQHRHGRLDVVDDAAQGRCGGRAGRQPARQPDADPGPSRPRRGPRHVRGLLRPPDRRGRAVRRDRRVLLLLVSRHDGLDGGEPPRPRTQVPQVRDDRRGPVSVQLDARRLWLLQLVQLELPGHAAGLHGQRGRTAGVAA